MAAIFSLLFVGFLMLSWTVNLAKFVGDDFEAPYKSEVLRGVGLMIFPVSMITAWVDLGETCNPDCERYNQ